MIKDKNFNLLVIIKIYRWISIEVELFIPFKYLSLSIYFYFISL